MLLSSWKSERLVFSEFSPTETDLAKAIFDKNKGKTHQDPTFREWPISEYEGLIGRSRVEKSPDELQAFYLRKITLKNGKDAGYVQLEINAPVIGKLWIPMLCIVPEYQSLGLGSEVVESIISVAREYVEIEEVGLNFYVENVDAFRFWYGQEFNQIRHFES